MARITINQDIQGPLNAGQDYTLNCDVPVGVTTTESAYYQWKRNNSSLQHTDQTLPLSMLKLSDAGVYFCNVTDDNIVYISGNLTITVNCKSPPLIL